MASVFSKLSAATSMLVVLAANQVYDTEAGAPPPVPAGGGGGGGNPTQGGGGGTPGGPTTIGGGGNGGGGINIQGGGGGGGGGFGGARRGGVGGGMGGGGGWDDMDVGGDDIFGGWGDPHFTAVNGKQFDFMETGTFHLLNANGLQVHAFMDACGAESANNGTCTYAIGVGLGDSVARIFLDDNKTVLTKGTNQLGALTVAAARGHTDGYRVFVASNPKTFVDVTLGSFGGGGGAFLDLGVALSGEFRGKEVTGVLSAGGSKNAKSSSEMAKEYRLADDKSLLTCETAACVELLGGKQARDSKNAKQISQSATAVSLLGDGYDQVDAKQVPLKKLNVAKISIKNRSKHKTAQGYNFKNTDTNDTKQHPKSLDKSRVTALCNKVIKSIHLCDAFVKLQSFFIDDVCVKDTLATGRMDTIDHAKLVYLRQCRRRVDLAIMNKNGTENAANALQARQKLGLADPEKCPKQCSSRGKCLVNGCSCNAGWSGLSCEVTLAKDENAKSDAKQQ